MHVTHHVLLLGIQTKQLELS